MSRVDEMIVTARPGRGTPAKFPAPLAGRALIAVTATVPLLLSGCGNLSPKNHAPVIKAQPDTSVVEGDTLHLQAVATDEDWDQLTYKAIVRITSNEYRRGFRGGALMNFNSGKFWFTARDTVPKAIIFVADDGRGGTDSTTFVIRVRGKPRQR